MKTIWYMLDDNDRKYIVTQYKFIEGLTLDELSIHLASNDETIRWKAIKVYYPKSLDSARDGIRELRRSSIKKAWVEKQKKKKEEK
jgi:hypothetical protein